jgi:hypothetical protein
MLSNTGSTIAAGRHVAELDLAMGEELPSGKPIDLVRNSKHRCSMSLPKSCGGAEEELPPRNVHRS